MTAPGRPRRARVVLRRRPARGLVALAALLAACAVGATPPVPPVAVTLGFAASPAVGQTGAVALSIAAQAALHDVRLAVRAAGVVALVDTPVRPPARLEPGDEHRQTLAVRIDGRGRGELDARVDALTAEDAAIARTATAYVVADEAGVGVGTSGFPVLERERLGVLRDRGLITPDEYERRLERLLGGGAQEKSR